MTIRHFLDIVEFRTKVISVSTYAIATLYSVWVGNDVGAGLAVLLFASMLCVDMGTTAFNTFYDYMRGVDNKLVSREKEKVLVHAGVAPGYALIVSLLLYSVAAVTGVIVAILSSWWIVPLGGAGLIVGFLYNGGPRPISRTPLGEVFAGGSLGTLLFIVVVAVHSGTLAWETVIASLPSSLVIASVLTVNNTCDIDGDREAGRRTLSVVAGRRMGEALVYVLGAAAYALMLVMSFSAPQGALPFAASLPWTGLIVAPVGLIVTIGEYARMHRIGYSHESKPAQMVAVTRVVVVFTLAYSVTLGSGLLAPSFQV